MKKKRKWYSIVLLSAEHLQYVSHSVLCKLTSSLTGCRHLHTVSIWLPVSLSTAYLSSSLFFCLSQLVRLRGHPSVYLPVYLHVCVSACVSASVSLSVSVTAKCCMFYASPSVRCISRGNIKKTNLSLSSWETDCFSALRFLTMILINELMKNVTWNNILP